MPGTALWVDGFICLPCLPSFVSRCLPAWMPGTALWVDAFVCLPGFTCLPLSPFICLPLSPSLDDAVWVDGFICLPLSFVSRCLPAWMPGTALWVDGFICLPLSPFICLPADAWRGSGSFVSLCLPSFVSRCLPAWMPGWTDSLVSLCLPSFVARCLPAWIWHGSLGGRVHVSPFVPFICLPFSPSLDAWHGSLGGRVHLSPFVSLDFSRCLAAWMFGTALWVDGLICLPLSPFICLPLVSQPGCLARLSGWTGSFVYLCLPACLAPLCFPSFVSRCLPAWMPVALFFWWTDSLFSLCLPSFGSPCLPAWMSVTALQADGFTCLPWFPFICLPSLWVDGFICFPLSPLPGCLARLSGWTDSFVSRCLPAWMCGRVFLHFPRFCPFGGVWFAFGFGPGFGHSLSCGCWGQGPPLSALHLDFDFAWARGGSSSLSIVGYTLSVRSVPRYQLRSRADDSGALRCAASATRRLC